MTFIHDSSVFTNSDNIRVHICFCRFLKNDTVRSYSTQSSRAAPDYSKAVHLCHPKSPAMTTEITLFFANLRCLCFLFCRDDGFHVSSIYIYHFVDELCSNFMSMWYRQLFVCHSHHRLNLSLIFFRYDMD